MGLKELKVSDLKKNKKIIKALEFYGVKEEDIKYIPLIPLLKESVDQIMAFLQNEKKNTNALQEHLNFMNEKIEELRTNGE